MKPVLILQHLSGDGPAYLGTWLERHGLEQRVFNSQSGDGFPDDIAPYGALAILGGEMSANDALPSLRRAEALVLQAVARGVPAIGHCLGGQLMARALGAQVTASPSPEVGWQPLTVLPGARAQDWLGEPGARQVLQWHCEAFALPAGATALASSTACPLQAFALGPHLAMQWHVEVDAEKLQRWAKDADAAYLASLGAPGSTQDGPSMLRDMVRYLGAQQAWADRIYGRWLASAVGA
jgi:GMP synthase (glutamine-hydrolysing)